MNKSFELQLPLVFELGAEVLQFLGCLDNMKHRAILSTCRCITAMEDRFQWRLSWQNPIEYSDIETH
jgi:hypothetical protein